MHLRTFFCAQCPRFGTQCALKYRTERKENGPYGVYMLLAHRLRVRDCLDLQDNYPSICLSSLQCTCSPGCLSIILPLPYGPCQLDYRYSTSYTPHKSFPLGLAGKTDFLVFVFKYLSNLRILRIFFCKLSTFYTYQLKMLFLNTFPLHYNLQAKAEKYPLDPRKKSRLWLGSNP